MPNEFGKQKTPNALTPNKSAQIILNLFKDNDFSTPETIEQVPEPG
jgi:hypothetical protein